MIIQLSRKEASRREVRNDDNRFLRPYKEMYYFKIMTGEEIEKEREKRIKEYRRELELYLKLKTKYEK